MNFLHAVAWSCSCVHNRDIRQQRTIGLMENNFLIVAFVLLAATVALVPLAKALGFGTILGYLLAGVLIGPYGIRLISDTDSVQRVSEFGIVMMLFLIGLEVQPLELWRMRNKLMGLGLTQLVGTAALIGIFTYLVGLSGQASVVVGLALAMSSTAIALQSITSRGIIQTDTGRGSLAVLLLQDVAVIPILALIPLLARQKAPTGEELVAHANWPATLQIIIAFGFTILAGRYLVRPIMRFVAKTGVHEAFTALGLAMVAGAALIMEWIGFSAALGAFMGGVLLADSEYRHELESVLEPFKGLLLGLFFISVGTSITFSIVWDQPFTILGLVLALVALKAGILFVLTKGFNMHLADRLLLSFMLSQSGEFAFVLLQFAARSGALTVNSLDTLTVIVALSMSVTPVLIYLFDRFIAPRMNRTDADHPADAIDTRQKVIVLGYGRFGQIVTRLLRAQGFEMTLIDDDPVQIDLMKRFGVKVFYGDGASLPMLQAAGAEQAELIIIAVPGRERILKIANMIRRHFPHVKIAARAIDRSHAHDLMDAGIEVWERETFKGALALGVKTLVALGYEQNHAQRLAVAFEEYDNRMLEETRALRGDTDAYVGYVRRSTEMLDEVMRADRLQIVGKADGNEALSLRDAPGVETPPAEAANQTGGQKQVD